MGVFCFAEAQACFMYLFCVTACYVTDPTNRKDYYKILGVSPNADQKEIKKSYFNVSTCFCVVYSIAVTSSLPPPPQNSQTV